MEGIVKYDFTFNKNRALRKSLVKEIESCRVRLYAMGLIGAYPDGLGYGNISQKVDDSSSFVITGTQTGDLPKLTPKHYSLVQECDDKNFCLTATGAAKPSSEALTHGTIYSLGPDIKAVIHIHSMPLWKFMLDNDYLHTSDVEYGSIEMVNEVERIYKNTNPLNQPIFAMAGHEEGIICFGRDMDEAELVLYKLIGEFMESIA